MNMPEAIEMLQRTLRYYESGDTPRSEQAIKLGIEALKAIQASDKALPTLIYQNYRERQRKQPHYTLLDTN